MGRFQSACGASCLFAGPSAAAFAPSAGKLLSDETIQWGRCYLHAYITPGDYRRSLARIILARLKWAVVRLMNRRQFIGSIASAITAGKHGKTISEDARCLTAFDAEQFAISFIGEMAHSDSLTASSRRLIDENFRALGYAVDLFDKEGYPVGYVVFDVTDPSLIAEFSFGHGAESPSSRLLQITPLGTDAGDSDVLVVRTSPFCYGIYDRNAEILFEDSNGLQSEYTISRAVPDSSWEEIFLQGDVLNSNEYKITEFIHPLEYEICYPEDYIISSVGKYACAVSAMLVLAARYIPLDSFYKTSIADHYNNLWRLSKTVTDHRSGDIYYGVTQTADIGPAVVSYCSEYGQRLQHNTVSSPSFSSFRSAASRGDFSIYCCGINRNGNREGHAMAVQGTAMIALNGSATTNQLQTLCVSDGWNGYTRFLNMAFSKFTDTNGVFFS